MGGAVALGAGEGLLEGPKCFISKGVTWKSSSVLYISWLARKGRTGQ